MGRVLSDQGEEQAHMAWPPTAADDSRLPSAARRARAWLPAALLLPYCGHGLKARAAGSGSQVRRVQGDM